MLGSLSSSSTHSSQDLPLHSNRFPFYENGGLKFFVQSPNDIKHNCQCERRVHEPTTGDWPRQQSVNHPKFGYLGYILLQRTDSTRLMVKTGEPISYPQLTGSPLVTGHPSLNQGMSPFNVAIVWNAPYRKLTLHFRTWAKSRSRHKAS